MIEDTSDAGPLRRAAADSEPAAAEVALTAKMETSDLSVFYGDKPAIIDVSVPVRRHRVTALIGPSELRQEHVPAR